MSGNFGARKNNPDCPSTNRSHGSQRAIRDRGCICDGPGLAALEAARERRRHNRSRERDRERERERVQVPAKPPTTPELPRWNDLERRLLERDDLPCQETDPELFASDTDLKPTERAFRETIAKAICGGCAWRVECLEVALARDERWTVMGGLTPAERRALKKAGAA